MKQMKLETQRTKNVWDAEKTVLRWKFIAINNYIKKGRTQINKTINEIRDITTDTTETQRIIRDYYAHIPTN